MTDIELKSCIGTIEMLRRLHGVMNVIDAGNCEKIIKVLSDIPKYKDAYNKGWDDGAKATYEHLKMCEEEQGGDLISRDAVIEIVEREQNKGDALSEIEKLSSVNPQESKTGHCKDCKWWKDSDGAFRRGIGAESQCPMNRIEVFEGDGYCYMFEPQDKDIIWYTNRNYSEIVVKPQESEE